MSRIQTRGFDLVINTTDSNCKKLGLSTYRYYLKEPVQILKQKYACEVSILYMQNKTKTLNFKYGTKIQLQAATTNGTTLPSASVTYVGYNSIL